MLVTNWNVTMATMYQDNPDKPAPECVHSGFYWS